jgi:hypothetical protein
MPCIVKFFVPEKTGFGRMSQAVGDIYPFQSLMEAKGSFPVFINPLYLFLNQSSTFSISSFLRSFFIRSRVNVLLQFESLLNSGCCSSP